MSDYKYDIQRIAESLVEDYDSLPPDKRYEVYRRAELLYAETQMMRAESHDN